MSSTEEYIPMHAISRELEGDNPWNDHRTAPIYNHEDAAERIEVERTLIDDAETVRREEINAERRLRTWMQSTLVNRNQYANVRICSLTYQ
jgi:hypothetical protein